MRGRATDLMAQPRETKLTHIRCATTPGAELNVLSAVYALCLQKHREKEKANKPVPEPVGRDDVKESSGYVAHTNHNR